MSTASNPNIALKFDTQAFAFETGMKFRGMSFTAKEDGFTIVLRGSDKDGTPVYCMRFVEDIQEGFKEMIEVMKSKESRYLWHFDGWAETRGGDK